MRIEFWIIPKIFGFQNISTSLKNFLALIGRPIGLPYSVEIDKYFGGVRKGADSYFPPEDRVRLVRLVSHGELPGERSGGSIVEYSWNNL